MALTLNLPTVADFRKHGCFYHLREMDIYQDIPSEILCHIFPFYYFKKDCISQDFIENLKFYCIYLKNRAKYEDEINELNEQKELLINRIRNEMKLKLLKD